VKFRSKLYRWVGKEWKERGIGDLKLLQNKATKDFRILMRQEKSHKVVANHFVSGEGICKLQPMKTNDKSWIWVAFDASEDKPKVEKLCARFLNKEDMAKFKEEFEKAYEFNVKNKKDAPKKEEEAKKTDEKKPEDAKKDEKKDEKKEEKKPEEKKPEEKAADKKPEEKKPEEAVPAEKKP